MTEQNNQTVTSEELECILRMIDEIHYNSWDGVVITEPYYPEFLKQKSHDSIAKWIENTVKPYLKAQVTERRNNN